jgi:tRNA(Ile)-lysidine synthase
MITDTVRRFLSQMDAGTCHILVAVSGGADSTALLVALADLRADGYAVSAAHVNHHLRAAESDADESFVRALCAELGVSVHVADGTLTDALIARDGVEGAARDVRITRLQEIRSLAEARYIATAHQRNDQAETVLMRLLTGSGIAGLRGIHPFREDGIIRPLLEVARRDIAGFLSARGIPWRTDTSNADERFLRNRVRRILSKVDDAAVDNLASIAAQAQQQWPLIEALIDEAEGKFVSIEADVTRFHAWPDNQWLRQALLLRHIRRLDAHTREVSSRDLARLAERPDSIRRVSVTGELELIRRGDELVLRRPPGICEEYEVPIDVDGRVRVPSGSEVLLRRVAPDGTFASADRTRQMFCAPAGSRRTGLQDGVPAFVIRNRRPGDRFHALGAPGSKKLKDFLIDRRIAPELRDRLPLLVWNGEIVWVAGVEVSDRFRVTGNETEVYEVSIVTPPPDQQDQESLRG